MVVLLYIPQYKARFDSAWIWLNEWVPFFPNFKNIFTGEFNTNAPGIIEQKFLLVALECCPDFI